MPTTPRPTTPTASRRLPVLAAAAILLAALTATSCSSTSSTATSAGNFTNWANNGGEAHINALSADVRAMGAAADLEADGQACASGVGHAQAAKAYPPIPDTLAQQHWARMLDQFAKAAQDCRDGAEQRNADLLSASAAELEQVQAESGALQARLRELAATQG